MQPRDDGYATPAAAVISVALAMVATAGVTRALAELRLARAELARTRTEYALSSAQNAAMLAIATSNQPPPYHWTLPSLGQAIDVVAEPERWKMSLPALAALDDASLTRLGATDPAALRNALGRSAAGEVEWVADADPGQAWKVCGPALASQFGAAAAPPALAYGDPMAGQKSGFWRAGEVWRIQVTEPDGWRDERIVRFTGNGLAPAAILGRRLSKGWKEGQTCEPTSAAS